MSLLLIGGGGLYVAYTLRHAGYDDSFITFRYARNIASGHGFVYNQGERYLGTTAPFYCLLLAAFGLPSPDTIPRISSIISGFSLILGGM